LWLGRKDGWFDMYILKRDGKKVEYNRDKIEKAVYRALKSIKHNKKEHLDKRLAEKIAFEVEDEVFSKFEDRLPSVEDIQDIVEQVLMSNELPATAKAYILYRQERTNDRILKAQIGVVDELKLPIPSVKLAKARYLLKDDNGVIKESIGGMVRRVSRTVGRGTKEKGQPSTPEFYEVISHTDYSW
jgi:ribonucleoside-diphosphate reductase alpha chain